MTVKQDIKMFLDNLSIRDKVEVLKELYKDIAGLGIEGDTELAHINTFEANLLVKCGGSGTLHPVTGLPQYKGGGGGTPQASYQNTSQASRLPEEVAPFAEDVLTEAQDYYRMIMNQGYDPYTGAVIAPQTAEQTEAQAGLSALGRGAQGTALQQEALDLQRQQAQKFTPEVAQEYMSPYQRAVTDIEKRKAVEDFQRNIMPQFEAQAVGAGGMSGLGSRAGVQAGILGENLQQRLGDIEAKGLQSAFLNAQQQFQNQKQREGAQAQNIANLGPAMFSQGLAQQGALQSVGEQKQRLGQQALDEQYFKFLEQKAFPEEQLAKYSGFVYGNPLLAQRDVTTTASAPGAQAPSTGQQLLGTGLAAASAFKQMAPQTFGSIGNFFRSPTISSKTGGGLSDMVYRAENGQTSPDVGKEYSILGSLYEALPDLEADKRAAERKKLIDLAEESPSSISSIVDRFYKGVTGDVKGLDRVRQEQFEARQKINNSSSESAAPKVAPVVLPPGAGSGGVDEGAYADASGNIIVDRIKEVQLAAQKAAAEKAAKAEKLARLDLGTVEGIEASAQENTRILNAAADMNKAIRTNARGEIDKTGMILQALANSLLKSIPGDPRDPASTRGTFLLRIADGLKDGSISINEAEVEMRKLERADAEAEIKDREKATKVKVGETKLLGELPAKLRALAVARAKQAGVKAKRLSDIAKNDSIRFKNYIDGLANLEKEGVGTEWSKGVVGKAVASMRNFSNPVAKVIADEIDDLGDSAKKEFAFQTLQTMLTTKYSMEEAAIIVAKEFNKNKRLGTNWFGGGGTEIKP